MASSCYNCKKNIADHDSQKMSGCLTALSSKLKSMESVLQVPGDDEIESNNVYKDFPSKVKFQNLKNFKMPLGLKGFFDYDEAIEYFSNTKLGEASRMGSK